MRGENSNVIGCEEARTIVRSTTSVSYAHADILSPVAVRELAVALRAVVPCAHLLIVLPDAQAEVMRIHGQCADANGSPLLPWGHGFSLETVCEQPHATTVVTVDDGEMSRREPTATLFRAGCSLAIHVPLRAGESQPGVLVLGWDGHAEAPSAETLAAIDLLGDLLGLPVARSLRERALAGAEPASERARLDARTLKQIGIAGHLSSLGTLAGGVVHEVNNPATYIALAAGQIAKGLGAAAGSLDATKTAQLIEVASGIQDAAKQIRTVVADFRQFVVGAQGSAMLTVEMERVLAAAASLTRAAHRHDVVLKTQIEALPPCPGNLIALGTATVNVLVNGIEALGHDHGPRNVHLHACMREENLEITVTDTGSGIAPKVLARVFEPFFTTRISEGHAGLGLTVVRETVEALGGTVRIASEAGVGTTVVMVVPVS